MNKRVTLNGTHSGESNLTWFLLILAGIALALGFFGFMVQSENAGLVAIHGAALRTVQLFILNLGPSDLPNWQTRIASVIAPLTTVGATLAAFSGRLKSWRQWASLQVNPAQDLYLGSGRTAAAIATSGRMPKKQTPRHIGVDLNHSTILEEEMAGHPGCFVLQGDATLSATLRRINACGATRVWIAAGNDAQNISILQSLILTEGNRALLSRGLGEDSSKATRRWFVDISNRDTVRLASTLFKNPKAVDIEYFNFERIAARRLMQKFAEEILPGLLSIQETRPQVHICVIGSGELAEAIILQSIQQLVVSESPEHCLRLTWIAPDAGERMRRLTKKIPVLGDFPANEQLFTGLLPLALTHCLDLDECNISPLEWSDAQKKCSFSCVYVACQEELLSSGSLFRVTALRDMASVVQERIAPIVICHWNKPPSWITELPFTGVMHFHVSSEIFRPGESYPGEHMDELAKLIHAFFCSRSTDEKPKDSEVERHWVGLAEHMKWSSRMSADHATVKDALMAKVEGKGPNKQRGINLTQDEVERNLPFLAQLEHRRFLVERLIEGSLPLARDGSRSGSRSASGLAYGDQKRWLRLNNTLVTYEKLDEKEIGSNILPSIRALPKLIAWAGSSTT